MFEFAPKPKVVPQPLVVRPKPKVKPEPVVEKAVPEKEVTQDVATTELKEDAVVSSKIGTANTSSTATGAEEGNSSFKNNSGSDGAAFKEQLANDPFRQLIVNHPFRQLANSAKLPVQTLPEAIAERQAQTTTGTTEKTAASTPVQQPKSKKKATTNNTVVPIKPFVRMTPASKLQKTALASTPKSAAEDPNFQAIKTQINATAKGQQQHTSAIHAVGSAQAAAPVASNEAIGMAQASQVSAMDAQEAGEFSASDFKAQLEGRIAQMQLPENEEAADNFEANNNIDEVNEKALGDVSNSKNAASGAIETTTAAKPDTASVTKREVKALPTPKYGKTPSIAGAGKAMPPKRTAAQVEQPLQEQTSSIDNQMAENNVTDEMLANSNEASFTGALAEKNAAKEQSVAATSQFRNQETTDQQNLQNSAQQETQNEVGGMNAAHTGGLNKVAGNQKDTATKNSDARKKIADSVNTIYGNTKTKVDTLLSSLDTDVAAKFINGSKVARKAFEDHVETKMTAYKKERYGDSWFNLKQLKRVGDAFVGLPKEVNEFFVSGREVYITTMDIYITEIANLVAQKLNEAKALIATGKTEVKTYVDGLAPDLQKLGKEAASSIEDKFDSLEQTVDDKKDALIDTLAEKYAENLASVDSKIEELKAANSGLINKALGALQGVFEFIIKVKNTLTNLLSKIVEVVVSIITDPIGFFKMLISGVGQGFKNFGSNVMKHLQTGFIGWLTGAMKGVSITMPEDVFSLKGIFSITMQVLGLGWNGIRAIGSKVIGEPIMKAIETGVEIVQVIRKDGIAGLWEHLKEQFQDLKATVMDSIMSMIQTQVIQAGIKWILGLLSPVGAFVKAAMAIVDVVKFFIERAAQIGELVNAFIDSVAAIASGKVGAVANSIENALGKAIPVLIGLLASILGIGGIANKVVGLIRKIRKRITKAITKFWKKIKKGAKKLLRKIGIGKKKDKKGQTGDLTEWWDNEEPVTTADNDSHTLYYKGEDENAVLYMASEKDAIERHLDNAEKANAENDTENLENIHATRKFYIGKLKPVEDKLRSEQKRTKKLSNEQSKEKNRKEIKSLDKDHDSLFEQLSELVAKIKFAKATPTTIKTNVIHTTHSVFEGKQRPKSVTASPLTWIAGNTIGSKPGGANPPGWEYAKNKVRENIYIRGHMLNDNIHGPNDNWNLVPITRTMNSTMEGEAESKGKNVLKKTSAIMYYKTTILDYHSGNIDPEHAYFPKNLRVEWGDLMKDGKHHPEGKVVNGGSKEFSQGVPPVPEAFNINDLGDINLKNYLGLDEKFANAVNEVRKSKGNFKNRSDLREKLGKYYSSRKSRIEEMKNGINKIGTLTKSGKLVF